MYILFTAHRLLKNNKYEPSGTAENTCAHLQHRITSASGLFHFLIVDRGGEIRTEVFLTNTQESVLQLTHSKA